jgi:hypothetical protein
MRRLVAVLFGVFGLMATSATPALAVRDLDDGSFPHLDGVRVLRPFPAQVSVGYWIKVGGGWAANSSDLRQTFEDNVTVTMTLDGIPQSVFRVHRDSTDPLGCTVSFVDYQFLHHPLEPGTHEVIQTWTASAHVADSLPGAAGCGFGDSMNAGDVRIFSRSIVVSTPGG